MDLNTMLHDLAAVIFIIMLALPFIALGLNKKPKDKVAGSLKFWRIMVMAANAALIVSVVTGILRSGGLYGTGWFWLVIVVFIAMGAFLGIATKAIRLIMEAAQKGESFEASRQKLLSSSWMFTILTIVMIVLMIWGPHF